MLQYGHIARSHGADFVPMHAESTSQVSCVSPVRRVMYESHIVSQFFREWGYKDGLNDAVKGNFGKHKPVSLLGNMQNPFDAFFGDVAVQKGARFQLIEFKQDRKSFNDEVTSEKDNRVALFYHLETDSDCRKFSYLGHAAGYVENNVLRLDPYYLTAKGLTKKDYSGKKESEYFHDFDSYYQMWNSPIEANESNVGLDAYDFKRYVECMYKHLGTNAYGVLLIYREVKKKNKEENDCKNKSDTKAKPKYELVPFYGSIDQMLDKLHTAFAALKSVRTTEEQDLSHFFKDEPPSSPTQTANAVQNMVANRPGVK